MTSLTVEWVGVATTRPERRALDRARRRAAELLGGRTVWCASALPGGRRSAGTLLDALGSAGTDATPAEAIDVAAGEPLAWLADQLQAMMRGAVSNALVLGPAERELYDDAAGDAEGMLGRAIATDDIVVLHDVLVAVLAQAARDRGAHVMWKLDVAPAPGGATVAGALAFMRPFTRAVDAYLTSWPAAALRPDIERIAAHMPGPDMVAAKDATSGGSAVRWSSALADTVDADRSETVGGTLHPRPRVAAR